MINLIKLELKKQKLGWYWRSALIATFAIIAFLTLVGLTQENGEQSFTTFDEAYMTIGILVRAVFSIFASVLISRLIINEYKNKTITVLFTYPIPRKQLIAAKLILIMGLTLITIVASLLVVTTAFTFINSYCHFIPGSPASSVLVNQGLNLLILSLSTTGLSLIPLYFGMRKKSVSTTIVSSILIISVISSTNNDFNLGSLAGVSVTLALIGLVIAYLSFRNIDRTDII